MDLKLAGRIALVGGGSRGIGFAIARTLLAEGARVAVTGRDTASLHSAGEQLSQEFSADRVLTVQSDLAHRESTVAAVDTVVKTWGVVECVVANAGSGALRGGWALSDADWTAAFDANLWPMVHIVEATLPAMVRTGRGSIVLISSIAARESLEAPVTYAASKAAVESYGNNLGRLVGGSGIRVNVVAPGNILFPGGTWARKLAEHALDVERYISREVPLRRFGTPEEIADVVAFLLSDRASFMTASCSVVDGGQSRAL